MTFHKGRPINVGTHALHDRIEPLAVADLQETTALRGEGDQLPGFGRCRGNRLFYQHMFAGFQTGFRRRKVGGGRGDHADDFHVPQQVVEIRPCLHRMAVGNELGAGCIRVKDSHQNRTGQSRIMPGVVLAQVAYADDPGPQRLHRNPLRMPKPASVPISTDIT